MLLYRAPNDEDGSTQPRPEPAGPDVNAAGIEGIQRMVKHAVMLCIVSVCLAAVSLCGCTRRTEETPDPVVEQLRSVRAGSPAEKERVESAISLRQNGVVDSQPVLFGAYIRRETDLGGGLVGSALGFTFYDEDEDVVGCVIREERTAPDGSRQVLVEEYPVFMHYPTDYPLQPRYFPIQIRASDQRKDDQRWKEYAETDIRDKISARDGMRYFIETLPPVYVSVPEPNHTNVLVSVYDRAGHESNPVEPHYVPPKRAMTPK